MCTIENETTSTESTVLTFNTPPIKLYTNFTIIPFLINVLLDS